MTEAQSETKLSGPYSDKSALKVAFDALPEKGRVISKGKSSAGRPIFDKAGASRSESAFAAPDAVNIFTPTTMATSVGKRESALSIPSFAPAVKSSKYGFFEKSIRIAAANTASGITRDEIYSIFSASPRAKVRAQTPRTQTSISTRARLYCTAQYSLPRGEAL